MQHNSFNAFGMYAGNLEMSSDNNESWVMFDVSVETAADPMMVKVYVDTPKIISMTEGYLNDYNRNRIMFVVGSFKQIGESVFLHLDQLVFIDKFYSQGELNRSSRKQIDFDED